MAVLAFGEAAEGRRSRAPGRRARRPRARRARRTGASCSSPGSAYALGDSRTPAVASVVVAVLGAVGMLAAAAATDGPDTPRAHRPRPHRGVRAGGDRAGGRGSTATSDRRGTPASCVPTAIAIAAGGLAWLAMEAWAPEGRIADAHRHRRARRARRWRATPAPCGSSGAAAIAARSPWRSCSGEPAGGRSRWPGRARGGVVVPAAPAAGRRSPPRTGACWCSPCRGCRGTSCTKATRRASTGSSTSRRWPPCRCATCFAAPRPGDGYAAMSAGAGRGACRPSGQVLEPDEEFLGCAGRPPCTRRHRCGARPSGLLALAFPALVERNEDLDYGAEIGALGRGAGRRRRAPRRPSPTPTAAASCPQAPSTARRGGGAGRRRGRGAQTGRCRPRCSSRHRPRPSACGCPTTAVVAGLRGDLGRGRRGAGGGFGPRARRPVRRGRRRRPTSEVRRQALRSTDALVGRAARSRSTRRATPSSSSRPYHRRGEAHLTVAGLRAPDVEPGLLRSGSTRRTGIVTLVDIAPTILDLAGVERPSSMEGRRFERVADGCVHRRGPGRPTSPSSTTASRYRDRMVAPVARLFVVLQAVLWVGAAHRARAVAARGGGAWSPSPP